MKLFLHLSLVFLLFTFTLHAERIKVNSSLVISGGVSLGAYEAGYNWALIKMLTNVKASSDLVDPDMRSIAGASAGSINALLSAMYWCQKDSVPLRTHVDDNLFYETWVNLGIEDLSIVGRHPNNENSLFTQDGLRKKGDKIIAHLKKPIFKKDCEVPLGVAVTKVTPIVEMISGIKMKNQNFSVPLTFKEKNGQGIVENRAMPPSNDFYISIPGIEKDRKKVINLLLASGAFPGAFQQLKLNYTYKDKNHSHYFVDGGLYDNVPLDLAIALANEPSHFFFMDPSNMRKETIEIDEDEDEEQLPVGFITPNLSPVLNSFDIMQSMKLYEAINQNFRGRIDNRLIISSRYHPITGKYLGHFGAFLDRNFRIYDYYVGVYDAIYHMANAFKTNFPNKFEGQSQIVIMNELKILLGLDKKPEALAAYTMFLNAEFYSKKPKTTDRFSAIYNAFDLKKSDSKRYGTEEFKTFLSKLDMKYLEETKDSFLVYAKADIDSWYKKPLRGIISRINILENEREKTGRPESFGTVTSVAAWGVSDSIKDKRGFEFLPLNVPEDKGKEGLRTALRLLPGEIAIGGKNGGLGFGYMGRYYTQNKDIINGFEGKVSYAMVHDTGDFVRGDLTVFKEYNDYLKLGLGGSFFGDMQGSFYKKDSAYGFNTYVDFMDIFRMTYVYRDGHNVTHNYLYLGIENIPSLIYWLNR